MILAIGCCLYLATGMLYGVLFQIVLTRFTVGMLLFGRFWLASLLVLTVWLVNYYGILSWLQPLLFGGNWILDRIPCGSRRLRTWPSAGRCYCSTPWVAMYPIA